MTQTEVETLLPVITPFAVPGLIDTLYEIALAQFKIAAPSCVGTSAENLAVVYYIAGMLSSGAGTVGVTSEKIDDYTISFAGGGQSDSYHALYQSIVDQCNHESMLFAGSAAVKRVDKLPCLDLDGAGMCL